MGSFCFYIIILTPLFRMEIINNQNDNDDGFF